MPLRDFHCDTCNTTEEFYYSPAVHPKCRTCQGPVSMTPNLASGRSKTAVFPFEGKHITPDGTPITITDIGHLRRIEKEYGVALTAFNQEPNNPDPIRDLPRYRGEERQRRR